MQQCGSLDVKYQGAILFICSILFMLLYAQYLKAGRLGSDYRIKPRSIFQT